MRLAAQRSLRGRPQRSLDFLRATKITNYGRSRRYPREGRVDPGSRQEYPGVRGKPLIAHTIAQAEAAETIDRSIVSTDDDRIATIAEEHRGNVPFIRPTELATDEATSPPVVEHALNWIEERGASPKMVVMLQVTSSLRTAGDIDGTVRRLRNDDAATSIVSVSEFKTPPQWALEIDEDGELSAHFDRDLFWTEDIPRSQDLESLYNPNGAIFAAEVSAFRRAQNFCTERTLGYEFPPERGIDIDEPFDLELVRALFEYEI